MMGRGQARQLAPAGLDRETLGADRVGADDEHGAVRRHAPAGERGSLSNRLDEVYRDRREKLLKLAGCGGADEAADLAHDAVVKTLQAGLRVEILDPSCFLLQATRNTLTDRFRSRARRKRVLGYGLEDADAPDPTPGAERALIAAQQLRAALAIIARMPPRRREALVLCRFEKLSHAEAGRRMGVTVHAIEKHLAAGKAQLAAELEQGPGQAAASSRRRLVKP